MNKATIKAFIAWLETASDEEIQSRHAKGLLDRVIHGDAQDCILGRRQHGLLWLNPPYGDAAPDRAVLGGADQQGRQRLEKLFYRLSNPVLQFGGVMVLIIPGYTVDRELAGWIASHFERVSIHRAATQFKQVVILGVRRRAQGLDAGVRDRLLERATAEDLPVLPVVWSESPYVVPAAPPGDATFACTRLDARQLAEEAYRNPGLWPRFDLTFGNVSRPTRRPLRPLSRWHLALALAAGQVSGVVKSRDGRIFVIKGDTSKDKLVRHEFDEKADGSVQETRVATDVFVPTIQAVDMTPGASLGRIVEIK